MDKVIEKQKLIDGRRSLNDAYDSIGIARKFPLKSKGMIKPKEGGWFEAIGSNYKKKQIN